MTNAVLNTVRFIHRKKKIWICDTTWTKTQERQQVKKKFITSNTEPTYEQEPIEHSGQKYEDNCMDRKTNFRKQPSHRG